jgi:hypothetical protein
MAENANTSRSNSILYYVIVLPVGLLLIYLLSVGPAVVIVVKAPKYRNQVRAIYTPMIWLHSHTPLGKPMDRYLDFWERTARRI